MAGFNTQAVNQAKANVDIGASARAAAKQNMGAAYEVDIFKKNLLGEQQLMTSVTPGATLGEMSMIDGEPRFATCIALKETTFAALTRDNMVKIILDKPSLGAKLLIKLVTMLSQRLRHTSAMLLQYMGNH